MCRRQVFDVPPPPPRPYVIEHRVQSRTCGGCGTTTEATAPAVASGRVQYGPGVKARAAWLTCAHFLPVRRARRVLNALLGFAVSPGWVAGLRAQAARLLETRFLPHVRALIAAAPVAHADETTARAAGSLTYLHVACTRFLTAMHVGDRSKDTIDAGGVWPAFTGVLVRDGYAGYEHLDKIEHAWCGIHLVRDLRAVHDPDPAGQSWAEAMVNTLLLANDTAHAARAEGRAALTDAELSTIRSRYAGAIARGRQENTRGSDPLHAASPHPAATLPATSGHDPAVHGEPGRELHEQHRRVAGQISEGSAADRAPRGVAVPDGGERPSRPCRRSGGVKLAAVDPGGRRGRWEQPRRSRVGPALPDGSGPVSETGRYTRETGVVTPLDVEPALTRWIRAGVRCVPIGRHGGGD